METIRSQPEARPGASAGALLLGLWATGAAFLLAACRPAPPTPRPEPPPSGTSLHLFDREPLADPAHRELVDPRIAEWIGAEGVWILDETVGAEDWRFDRELGEYAHWLASLDYPRARPRALVSLERLRIPEERTLAGSGRARAEEADTAALFREGALSVLRAVEDGPPPAMRVTYFADPGAVRGDLVTVDPERGEFAPRTRILGREARRALGAAAPWSVGWSVPVPAGASLRFAVGLGAKQAVLTEDGLEMRAHEQGTLDLRVIAVRGDGVEEVLQASADPEAPTGAFRDASIDLGAFAGEDVVLRFEFGADPGAAATPTPVFLAEPVLESPAPPERPDFILVLIDTLRADRLGCYGWERAHTPHLDRLAERGVRFDQVTSPAPWTLPSLASIFSSLYVSEHGIWINESLPEQAVTLASVLRDASYLTAAFTEGGYAGTSHGLSAGFGLYQTGPRDVEQTFERAREWLASVRGSYFLVVHTYQPHVPYKAPERWTERLVRPYDGPLERVFKDPDHPWGVRGPDEPIPEDDLRYIQDHYDAEIAYTDEALGAFLAWLEERGLDRNLVLLVTSDHGEEFGEHGHFGHGWSLYEEQLRVPLIVHAPGHFEGGLVARHRVHSLDVAPTFVELAGLPLPPTWSGVPLSPQAPQTVRHVFSTFYTRWERERATAYLVGDEKFISFPARFRRCDLHPDEVLFDLAADPGEQVDRLVGESRARSRWKRAAEHAWRAHPERFQAQEVAVGDALTRELQDLGYISGD